MAVTFAAMKDKLLTLDRVREVLATTEPMESVSFDTGPGVRFHVSGDTWPKGAESLPGNALTGVYVTLGPPGAQHEYLLSKEALLNAASECRITRGYAQVCPGDLLEPQLNYWLRGGLGEKTYKLLVHQNAVQAMVRRTVEPFSNLRFLDIAEAKLQQHFGGQASEVLADFKFHHDLRSTAVRLVVPAFHTVTGPGTAEDDTWSTGVQLLNSQIGLRQTRIDAYLFRWRCTNGLCDVLASSGGWNRRAGQGEEVYEWAAAAVDEVLGGLEGALDGVQATTGIPVAGDVAVVLRDLFAQSGLPHGLRSRVVEQMAECAGELSMYSVLQAVTQAANEEGLAPGQVQALLELGGHVAHAAHARCSAEHPCRRLLPAGMVLAADGVS